ncbi:alkyl sulfatase C-terminal domain-containing protein [Streptomyces sp. NPDC056503]|uniref:alkyl sulfatase C-terminal domain-containing protein n=1 Tax=Streptomyces sp. NPDC056503 TaxID=3345842 RepID=UPI0036C991C3
MTYTPKAATPATAAANREAVTRYAMDDRQDFADADRGFIAPFPDRMYGADGRVIFDASRFDHLAEDAPAPDTVDPSLWRQSQVIRKGGLYKVVDGIYQVRNNDIANLTVIEGDSGLVVVDYAAVHLIGDKAATADLRIDFHFTDTDETWSARVRHGVLNARRGASPETRLTVSGPKPALVGALLKPASAPDLVEAGKITLDGDETVLRTLAGPLDEFDPNFGIVTP